MFGLVRFAVRSLCGLVLTVLLVGLFAVFIEPHWASESRTLSLRVRSGGEVVDVARTWAEAVGEGELPAVASPPDALTEEDRERLDRLLEEKLRE